MKKYFFLIVIIIAVKNVTAQNVGIGTTEAQNKLQVAGSILVNAPAKYGFSAPTVVQTKNLVNGSTFSFFTGDSTGRLFDPGGPGGNYQPNVTATATIPDGTSCIGFEIIFEDAGLGSGDSIIIKESASSSTYLLGAGNRNNPNGSYIFNVSHLFVSFKSNGDTEVGQGFSLLFRKLYDNSASLPAVSGFAGNALFFEAKTGVFRSGIIDNSSRGDYSVAMGKAVIASGDLSIAMGSNNSASGYASFAAGRNNTANGFYSTAMGFNTTASGLHSTTFGSGTAANTNYATAMGFNTRAYGSYSTAMGNDTYASGNNATAMGLNSDALGITSVAMGSSTMASGDYSLATGVGTNATGDRSTALGNNTTASGESATAMGILTTASGNNSFAAGLNSTASGFSSISIGSNTIASGDYSVAIGKWVSSNNQEGSFLMGDNSTSTMMNAPAPNNFRARFANGYRLYTSSNYSTSCSLGAGDNAWTTTSDIRLKENFETINGEDFLKKISTMQLVSWNYKKQDPSKFRHYGPMAQDFYAAFGKDKYGSIGNDTTINSADFAGVSFIAIQALEKRTQKIEKLEQENAELKKLLAYLKKEMDDLNKIIKQNR